MCVEKAWDDERVQATIARVGRTKKKGGGGERASAGWGVEGE